jgi:uncharacterized protein YndB with AHSA1/START domain
MIVTKSAESRFVYVTYIRATPERLWSALTTPEFAQQYWRGVRPDAEWKKGGVRPEADWKVGGAWKLILPDGRVADTGEIVEFEPAKRLVIRWRNEFRPELKAEGWSLCVMEIESMGDAVKLTVTHSMEREGAKLIDAVSEGWPQVLANLKSLLETGSIVAPPRES